MSHETGHKILVKIVEYKDISENQSERTTDRIRDVLLVRETKSASELEPLEPSIRTVVKVVIHDPILNEDQLRTKRELINGVEFETVYTGREVPA
jgi:hypothetical protein